MNKTAILSFILAEVALKARNVSANMRKRVHWLLKEKEITVRKYDKRALVLNGWIRVGRKDAWIQKVEKIKKGVANYKIENKEYFDKIKALNNGVKCFSFKFSSKKCYYIDSVAFLTVKRSDLKRIQKCTFGSIKRLELAGLSSSQIESVLSSAKQIEDLQIESPNSPNFPIFSSMNLNLSKISKITFNKVDFAEIVHFPPTIQLLRLKKCTGLKFLNCKKVFHLEYSSFYTECPEIWDLANRIKGLKKCNISRSLNECFDNAPSTIRYLNPSSISYGSGLDLEKAKEKFPYLIGINTQFTPKNAQKLNLREITPILHQSEDVTSFRPRKVTLIGGFISGLEKNKEMFEKVESLVLYTDVMNFDWLPAEIKRITLFSNLEIKSCSLIRLEEEQ